MVLIVLVANLYKFYLILPYPQKEIEFILQTSCPTKKKTRGRICVFSGADSGFVFGINKGEAIMRSTEFRGGMGKVEGIPLSLWKKN